METSARHLLIGSIALAFVGAGFFLAIWLAQVRIGQESYSIYFHQSVAGLTEGADVQIEGVPIGMVTSVGLDRDDPGQAVVKISVRSGSPIGQGSVATLEMQGLTGGHAVSITGVPANARPLEAKDGAPPVIPSKPSGIQQMIDNAPKMARQAQSVLDALDRLTAQEAKSLPKISANIEVLTGALADHRDQITSAVQNAATAAQTANRVLANVDATDVEELRPLLQSSGEAVRSLTELIGQSRQILAENRKPIHAFTDEGMLELRQTVAEARTLIERLDRVAQILEREPNAFLSGKAAPTFTPGSGR
jgi:phospholipid/cholesterol/gamma-HCH transport system substrate-binding protein